jgi:tRNA-Thr(GGU) m(6)t(6)A37 methyltransferase TsaA
MKADSSAGDFVFMVFYWQPGIIYTKRISMDTTKQTAFWQQIGVIHSPYGEKKEAPFQGRHDMAPCTIEVFEPYEPGLLDIDTCSHLFVLYWQDKSDRKILQSKTPWGPDVHGVFATRSPNRPNPVGLCVVDLIERKGRYLEVKGLDALNGSPLIDIKPYAAGIDAFPDAGIGWSKS